MFAWLRPSDAHNLEGDERYRLRPALERLHHTNKCALKPVHQEAVVHPHSFVGAHVDGTLVSQQSDSSMMQACTHTRFVSSWISGNEHSSTHRPLSFIIFARLYLRDISMLSVVFSNVTMPLHRKVRLQHEAAAETMSTKADVACSHEARYHRAKKKTSIRTRWAISSCP